MALINDIELENGLSVEGAYLRIVNFSGTENNVNFVLNVYASVNAFNEERPPITSFSYRIDYDKNRNLFSQMYDYLRTLPEYEDAVEA